MANTKLGLRNVGELIGYPTADQLVALPRNIGNFVTIAAGSDNPDAGIEEAVRKGDIPRTRYGGELALAGVGGQAEA